MSFFLNQTLSKNFVLWLESMFVFMFVFFIGFLFKKYVAKFIQNMLSKIGLVLHDKIVVMSSSYISFWFFLIALYFSFLKAPINNKSIIVHKLFYMVFAFSIVILLASILSRFFRRSVHERIGANIIKFAVVFIGLMLILNQAGIKLTPILTALGIGSLAVALALQDTLANFFAGVNIILSKQIARDDYIKLDSGYEGRVLEVNWRTSIIREISNSVIIIPNSKISSSIVTSFHFKKSEVSASVNCGVEYGSDLEHVERIAKQSAQEVIDSHKDSSVKTSVPTVYFTGFSDSSINFTLFFRVKNIYVRAFIQSAVLKNLYKNFNEEKIEILFSQRVVTINK
jgi:small-conductance mechanosensitive channel